MSAQPATQPSDQPADTSDEWHRHLLGHDVRSTGDCRGHHRLAHHQGELSGQHMHVLLHHALIAIASAVIVGLVMRHGPPSAA